MNSQSLCCWQDLIHQQSLRIEPRAVTDKTELPNGTKIFSDPKPLKTRRDYLSGAFKTVRQRTSSQPQQNPFAKSSAEASSVSLPNPSSPGRSVSVSAMSAPVGLRSAASAAVSDVQNQTDQPPHRSVR